MSDLLEQFAATLKANSYSLTEPRQLVFTALKGKEPQTMQEIITACRRQIDRASVYRTISLFESLNIVQRLQIGWKYKLELSDAFHSHHHHMTCSHCSKTFALAEDSKLEKELKRLAKKQGFAMTGHQLEIQGLCHRCYLEKGKESSELGLR